MSNRSYRSFLNVFDDYPEKMSSKQIHSRYKESNGKEIKIRTVYSTLSRMVKEKIIKRDKEGFYLDKKESVE